jgi:hypothetical protein
VNAATLSFGIAFAMMFFAFFFYMSTSGTTARHAPVWQSRPAR